MRWCGDGWDTVRPVGGTVCRGDPPGRPDAMGDAVQWAMHAMGDAPRRSDAHRDGRMGTVGRGTACRAPTIMGDPSGRPYDGQPDVMGDARDG
ncbi:MAG: hypothetical protein KatS3mg109_1616 [Pirellulaceae bacterium]|nr:MAG: hypothetical protein KatS3mg109_1616 [Pirellulaceae bacterium]